jgi:hypothetical protein
VYRSDAPRRPTDDNDRYRRSDDDAEGRHPTLDFNHDLCVRHEQGD